MRPISQIGKLKVTPWARTSVHVDAHLAFRVRHRVEWGYMGEVRTQIEGKIAGQVVPWAHGEARHAT